MKKFLQIFFIVLGVIFFILILIGAYFFVFDPFGIKPLLSGISNESASVTETDSTTKESDSVVVDKNPLLSETQEKTLEKIGVDPAKLPTNITPEMEECFYMKLGETRANEIKNGATPTTADFFAARSCL